MNPAGPRNEAGGQAARDLLGGHGELSEVSLGAYGDDGNDLMLTLNRLIVNGEEEYAFVQASDAQAQRSTIAGGRQANGGLGGVRHTLVDTSYGQT